MRAAFDRHRKARYCAGIFHAFLFERLHFLRGMENAFADFYSHEKDVRRFLERTHQYNMDLIRRWGTTGADAVFITEDFGTQTAMMISPDMWRKFFKSYYREAMDEAHRCGMDVIYHSCGNIMEIIPDLIEIGLDVLDPVQPGAMDVVEVARRFGGQLSFKGTIDDQNLLAFGSPREIKETIRRTIDVLARPFGDGLILSPANVMTPEIPIENLQALFEACHGK